MLAIKCAVGHGPNAAPANREKLAHKPGSGV